MGKPAPDALLRLIDRFDQDRKEVSQRQIAVPDKQIDALVYELYGLMEEEIDIVEEG
jgi:ABC-type Fe2+-enterobactin transport system substrate-binding protein